VEPEMKVQYVSVDEITPYENNPRNNEGGVGAVANSIRKFGWRVPILVDEENVIIAGHTRLKAAKKLGLERVPIVVASGLTPAQCKAYRLADNKTSELSHWNFDTLNIELDDLLKFPDIDMGEFGFKAFEVEDDNLPDELKGKELSPDELPKLMGDNHVPYDRIIITFLPEEQGELEERLGITFGRKRLFAAKELLDKNGEQDER